jgi:hypothetical protein
MRRLTCGAILRFRVAVYSARTNGNNGWDRSEAITSTRRTAKKLANIATDQPGNGSVAAKAMTASLFRGIAIKAMTAVRRMHEARDPVDAHVPKRIRAQR